MIVHQTNSLQFPGSTVAIGAFDGVHCGHQAVLREMVKLSRSKGVQSVVYTFYPPPRSYFHGAQILTKLEKKIELIKNLGVNHIVLAEFNKKYLERSPNDFIQELALMNPIGIFVGEDFRFGHNRTGDVQLLKEQFLVHSLPPICCTDGQRISSTRIRELIKHGKKEQAVPLLGWT